MSQTLNLPVSSSQPNYNCPQNLIAYILSAFHELGHLFMLSVETIFTKTYLAL